MKKLLSICLVLLFVLPLMTSCLVANAAVTTLVPTTSNIVVQVQVGKILSNPATTMAYNELAKAKSSWPMTFDDVLVKFFQKTGLDITSVSVMVFFADIESFDKMQSTYKGIIASGSFNEATLTAKIEQQTQQVLSRTDYKGLKVYSGMPDNFEMVFLNPGQFVLGSPKAVRDTIDVSKGDQKALSGNLIDSLNRVGDGLITGSFAPPENIRTQLSKVILQKAQIQVKSIQDLDVVAFAFDMPNLSLNTRIDAHFLNINSVQDARDAITGLISVAKGTSQDPNVKAALGNIQVSTSDSWLSVKQSNNIADIATFIGKAQSQK